MNDHVPNRQRTRGLHTGSKAWRAIRQQVLVRDGYRCQACNLLVTGKQAHVDHRDGNSHNQDMDNLRCLCIRCHSATTRSAQNGAKWQGPRPRIGLDGWPEGSK